MNISNSKGTVITNLQTWEQAFKEVDGELHWKPGRSAYCLAEHFTSPDIDNSEGLSLVRSTLDYFGLRSIIFEKASIEYETMFDNFQNGRVHDLVFWGKTSNCRPVVTCVEAKVDETFGPTVKEIYRKGINHVSKSKVLIRAHMLASFLNMDFCSVLNLRYQLLTSLVGSIIEGWKKEGASVFMPVIVYKTKQYDQDKGKQNKDDFIHFVNALSFYQVIIDSTTMTYCREINGVSVIISYIEIDRT